MMTTGSFFLETLNDFLLKNKGKTVFLEHEVKGFLKNMGLPVPKGIFIDKETRLSAISSRLSEFSYPLAAKVSSATITSKSDVKGVRLGISNKDDLDKAVSELMRIDNAEGVLVEEMAPHGIEVIIGGVVDRQFGPIVMFGLGGVFVELFKDVAFGLAPLDRDNALWLIKQIKGYKLLKGYRGSPPADINALVDTIIAISEIMATNMIEEIDLNPVALYPQGAMILDAKMEMSG